LNDLKGTFKWIHNIFSRHSTQFYF